MSKAVRGGTLDSAVGTGEVAIGERIRARREYLGMTQAELAGTEMTRSFISQIERGRRKPTAEYLVVIAARLEVPAIELLDGVERGLRKVTLLQLAELLLLRGGETARVRGILEEVRSLLVTQGDEVQFEILSAQVLVEQREFSAALTRAKRAVDLSSKLKDIESRIRALQILVHAYSRMARQDSALPYAVEAVELAETGVVSASLKARAHANLATVEFLLGDTAAAVRQYESALRIAGETRDLVIMAHAETFLGEAAREQNDWVKAIQHIERGLILASRLELHELWVTSMHNLGQAYLNIGKIKEARSNQLGAYEGARRFNFDRMVPMVAEQMALVELTEGNAERAREIAEGALELAEEVGDDCLALILTRLAEATARTRGMEQAEEIFRRASDVAASGERWEHMPQAAVLREVSLAWGNACRKSGDNERALDLYYSAATVGTGLRSSLRE